MHFNKPFPLLLGAILLFNYCAGQQKADNDDKPIIYTADSLASGSYKDVFSSFYQLAALNLTGPNKNIHFTTNPFAIMMRADPTLANNKQYLETRNKVLRNLNIDFNAALNSDFNFNGFALGLKYAVLNMRDKSMSKDFRRENMRKDSMYTNLFNSAVKFVILELKKNARFLNAVNRIKDSLKQADSRKKILAFLNLEETETDTSKIITRYYLYIHSQINDAYNKDIQFDKLDTIAKWILKKKAEENCSSCYEQFMSNSSLVISKEKNREFDSIVNNLSKKPLWTIGVSDTSYENGALFKSMQLSTEFLKGLGSSNERINMEIEARAAYTFTNDSLLPGKNLSRQFLTCGIGANLIFRNRKTNQSFLEVGINCNYNNVFKGKKNDENKSNFLLTSTVSLRLFEEIWIPLSIAYNPKSSNLFGFLSVKSNFRGLNNLFTPR